MKPFPPTLREKRRYIVFELISEKSLGKKEVKEGIWKNILENIGIIGAAETGFLFIDFDEKTQKGILRCKNIDLNKIKASLCMLSEINLNKACVHIKAVTGSIKKACELLGG